MLLALFVFSTSGVAQRKISGVVEDAKSNAPLEGATIALEGSTTNAISKSGGEFEITVPNGAATLIVSFVGYETKTVNVPMNSDHLLVKSIK